MSNSYIPGIETGFQFAQQSWSNRDLEKEWISDQKDKFSHFQLWESHAKVSSFRVSYYKTLFTT